MKTEREIEATRNFIRGLDAEQKEIAREELGLAPTKFVRCADCEYYAKKYGVRWCRLGDGLGDDLSEDDGCTRGKAAE